MVVKNEDGWVVTTDTIKSIDVYEDGGCSYGMENEGWHSGLTSDEVKTFVDATGRLPQAGDTVAIYGKGFGFRVEGVEISGVRVRYNTPEQSEINRLLWLAEHEVKKLKALRDNLEDYKARVTYLPAPFEARIRRFEKENGLLNFWKDDGGYELFVLEQAAYLADWAREQEKTDSEDGIANTAVEWLDYWWSLNTKEHGYNWQRQHEIAPGWSDEHSGNTASGAYVFAKALLEGRTDF